MKPIPLFVKRFSNLRPRKAKKVGTLDWINSIMDFKHFLHQNYCDYNRRGTSNREGSANRSFRKEIAENADTCPHCGSYNWTPGRSFGLIVILFGLFMFVCWIVN